MDLNKLADALIPDKDLKPLEYYEQTYPEREIPQGAEVTRIAPSPTGFMHLGNLYVALANERIAHQSGGVFYLRIEDTDAKRKVEGAVEVVHQSLKYFGISFDEGADLCGNYGPYYQRQRAEVYHAYAKDLIKRGLAYPCFCTEEELEKTREYQTEQKLLPGYYGEFAKCRNLTEEEIYENLKNGKPYVIRLKSQGNVEIKHDFHDAIKGDITVTENNQDIVILKSDGIPTYHFAHAIDDHFMRTTLVIRGEEWLSSLPIHIELFKVLGFKLPKYGHNCSIQKIDGETRRKLSKRKDPEASLTFYRQEGYLPVAVNTYMMTLLNSNFEEWSLKNPDADYRDFKYNIAKMGKSGALFDILKLNDISKTYMSKLSEEEMYDFLKTWADEFGTEEQKAYFANKEYFLKVLVLCMGIGSKKRRKDFICARQALETVAYFFNTVATEKTYKYDKATVEKIIADFMETYSYSDDCSAWFDKVKAVADKNGFASDMKAYKANPDAFKGNVSDIAEEADQSDVVDESEDIIESDNQTQDRISEVLQDATESLYARLPENEETESLPEIEETTAEKENEQEELPAPVVPDSPIEEATPSDIQPVSVEQVNSEEATESIIPDDSNNEMQQVQSPAPTKSNIWLYVCLSLLVLMLMIVSYFAGYYRLLCPCVGCGEAAPKVEKVEDEDTLTTTPVEEPEVIEENPADNFEQVPGGQYLIVGTKGTHVMKAGDSLLKIAIREYGHKDYVKYIIVHNGFCNPDVIPLGYEVKLPELK